MQRRASPRSAMLSGMPEGRIVIVNGASSTGKSTLIDRFVAQQAAAHDCWIATGIDDYIAKLPWQWFDIDQIAGPYASDGLRFTGDDHERTILVGETGRHLFAAYRRTVGVWARQGLNVIVDEVTLDEATARDWVEALAGLQPTWIGLHCDADVAVARERARGDRALGLSRGQSQVVHRYVRYDLKLDSTTATAQQLVDELTTFLAGGPHTAERPGGHGPRVQG